MISSAHGGAPNRINATLPPCLVLLRRVMHMSDSHLPREGGLWGLRNCSFHNYGLLVEMAPFNLKLFMPKFYNLEQTRALYGFTWYDLCRDSFTGAICYSHHRLFWTVKCVCCIAQTGKKRKALTTLDFQWPWWLGSWPAVVIVVFNCVGQRPGHEQCLPRR